MQSKQSLTQLTTGVASALQNEQTQEGSLLRPADLQHLLKSSTNFGTLTLPKALQQLSTLAQQQESIEDQRSSLPSLQVQYDTNAASGATLLLLMQMRACT